MIALFGSLLLLTAGFILLSANDVTTQSASPQEVSAKWQALVDAINAGNQAEAERIAKWLDEHGKGIELEVEEATGRFICAWCGKDLGPSGTVEDSHGICERCKETYFGAGDE